MEDRGNHIERSILREYSSPRHGLLETLKQAFIFISDCFGQAELCWREMRMRMCRTPPAKSYVIFSFNVKMKMLATRFRNCII